MSSFQNTIECINSPQECDTERQNVIGEIENLTGRRLLVYVADLKKPESILNIEDKTGFSDLIEDIDTDSVDVFISSPGGFAEVTESIVGILRHKYANIRFVIPNMAKSAATLMALSGDEILMDHRSELGPIDPQVQYMTSEGIRQEAAEDISEGFEEIKDILTKEGPEAAPAYVPLLNKYTIGLLRECKNSMNLARELAKTWLETYMFEGDGSSANPENITEFFASHTGTLSHSRAILIDKCIELGLKVVDLRDPQHKELSDKIWELWCLYELHFERTSVYKIYENSAGCLLQKHSVPIGIQIPGPEQAQQAQIQQIIQQ